MLINQRTIPQNKVFLQLNTRKRIFTTEEQLILAVKQLLNKQFYTEQGEQLSIVYLGKREGNNGPDFQGALINNRYGQILKGDIEVHIYASDWYHHGHQHNSVYNNVILHIVAQQHPNNITRTKDGRSIALLCLPCELYIQPYLMQHFHLPCYQINHRKENHFLHKLLNIAGEQRFRQKALAFQSQMLFEKPSNVLFRGLLRALGYSKNMSPFEELARRLPINVIEQLEPHENIYAKQALLLGTAGLLPSQRKTTIFPKENRMNILETIWKDNPRNKSSMNEQEWQLSHIYPSSSPINRILALGHIIQRHHKTGFLKGLLQLGYKSATATGYPSIEAGLTVQGDNHLREPSCLTTTVRLHKTALLGRDKASQIAVNVILPFVFSWSEIVSKPAIKKRALDIYTCHQGMAENTITRHMQAQFGLGSNIVFSACQQQGLIHLYKNYCTEGRCSQCPLPN